MSKKDEKDLKAGEPVPEPTNAKVTNAEQPKFPKLFGLAMLLGPFVWLAPAGNVRNTLLPQYFSQIDPVVRLPPLRLWRQFIHCCGDCQHFIWWFIRYYPDPLG